MSLKKQYLQTKPACKVTFTINGKTLTEAKKINLVGEFNHWDLNSIVMKKQKNGNFTVSLTLEKGECQFKYLVDGNQWLNDNEADKYVPNEYLGENSVVVV